MVFAWIKQKYYEYELYSGLYMLDTWEKLVFSKLLLFFLLAWSHACLLVCSLSCLPANPTGSTRRGSE